MWNLHRETKQNEHLVSWSIIYDSRPVSYQTVIDAWQQDATFRDFFIAQLRQCPFDAFRWETPPITLNTAHHTFECVVINSPGLGNRAPDRHTFAQHFTTQDSVVTFLNLGKNAQLVVPNPPNPPLDYSHLSAFCQHAPKAQQHALWTMVGRSMAKRLNKKPVWLSTAGGGVAWLHIRLDDFPKYYHYTPYRTQY